MYFSLEAFPDNPPLKDESGLPWGCSIQPFYQLEQKTENGESMKPLKLETIGRCSKCFGYINSFVRWSRKSWTCPLCYNVNDISQHPRYKFVDSRKDCEELLHTVMEYVVPNEKSEENFSLHPLFVAIADATADPDTLEIIKEGLKAVIEALHPNSYFGLITFSDRIGLWNLHSSLPHVFQLFIPQSGECSVYIEDVFPNGRLFVQIKENKDHIISTIQSLNSLPNRENLKRGFGTTLENIIHYIQTSPFKCARVLSFLTGLPNYGQGSIPKPKNIENQGLEPQITFYKDKANPLSGICFDTYIISNEEYVGLSSLKFISYKTGGNLIFYPDKQNCGLPQDMYLYYSKPLAFRGMLRLRTSTPFKSKYSFGNLFPDLTYNDIYHLPGCDIFKTFTFDFEFCDTQFGDYYDERRPTVQVAFSFTTQNQEGILENKLRVITAQSLIATAPQGVYLKASGDNVFCLLMQKILRAILEEGFEEGRLLLQDWLTIFIANFTRNTSEFKKIDLEFQKYPNLKFLCHELFGLSKSVILNPKLYHPDQWSYYHVLFSSLEPHLLRKAVYPFLISYVDEETVHNTDLILTHSAVQTENVQLFLLDSFFVIIVYYLEKLSGESNKEEHIAKSFPPSKDSKLKKTINAFKQERNLTPRIIMAKSGVQQEQFIFETYLIEEENQQGMSYNTFIEFIRNETIKCLK